ncbi:MAG: Crp/Fnr family transcriptional regulator [Rhodanobacteraceae bacterium]
MHRDDQTLRRHYLLAAVDDAQWQRLSPHLHVRRLRVGQRLFSQGDSADVFYIVRYGKMRLFRVSPQGGEKIMRLVRAGQSFAESVLFTEPPCYPVHAQAVEACELIAIEREAYLRILRESFETCRAVMAQMTERIHTHWNEIEALSLHGAVPRLARYLLEQHASRDSSALHLPFPKAQIAAQLAVTPETLSRGLRTLIGRGVIAVRGPVIRILNEPALRSIARI